MHTVDLLDQALRAVQRLGYRVRQDWLGGCGGGGCEVHGQKWLFLDLGDTPAEQLHIVAEVLENEISKHPIELDAKLQGFIQRRAAA